MDSAYVMTSIAQSIEEMAHFAKKLRRTTAVRGPAGIGKSTAAQVLALRDEKTIYGDARTFAAEKYFLRFITSALRLPVYNERSNFTLREILHEHLYQDDQHGGSDYLLVIDEMQELQLGTLRTVVGLGEEYRLPILLVGNERALEPRPRMDRATYDQVLSRVSMQRKLKGPTADDFAEFARVEGVTDPAAIAALAAYGQRSSFREVRNLIELTTATAGAVDLSALTAAIVLIKGDLGSTRFLTPLKKAA